MVVLHPLLAFNIFCLVMQLGLAKSLWSKFKIVMYGIYKGNMIICGAFNHLFITVVTLRTQTIPTLLLEMRFHLV